MEFKFDNDTSIKLVTFNLDDSTEEELKALYRIFSKDVRGLELSKDELSLHRLISSKLKSKIEIVQGVKKIEIELGLDRLNEFIIAFNEIINRANRFDQLGFRQFIYENSVITRINSDYIRQVDREMYELENKEKLDQLRAQGAKV